MICGEVFGGVSTLGSGAGCGRDGSFSTLGSATGSFFSGRLSPGKSIGGMSWSGSSSSWSRASSKVNLNIPAMTLRAETLLLERGDIGDSGCGDRSAAIKSRAAAMAKSVDKDIGVRPLVGNHTTVSEIRSPRVS